MPLHSRDVRQELEVLAQLIATPGGRDNILGVQRAAPQSAEAKLQAAGRIAEYSRTVDYQAWVQKVWEMVLHNYNMILDPKATQTEVDFNRGALLATLSILRLAHEAHATQERLSKQNVKK